MHKELSKYTILLGSKSPRREALLKQSGFNFKKVFIDIDESFPPGMQATFAAMYLAERKSMSYSSNLLNNEILLTSDTVVVVNKNDILAKPENKKEAVLMLKELSGKSHEVITAVCLRDRSKKETFYDSSKVFFNDLNEEDINYYVDNFKPMDKAGAYGIQEWIGLTNIWKIEGSYFTIVGLPCHLIVKAIKSW